MHNKKISTLIISAAVTMSMFSVTAYAGDINKSISSYTNDYREFTTKEVSKNKVFEIKFNRDINSKTLSSIKVINDDGVIQSTSCSLKDERTVKVNPPKEGYNEGSYALIVKKDIKSLDNKAMKKGVVKKFTVKENNNTDTVERDSMEIILNAYRGTKRDFNKKQWDYSEFLQPLHTEDSYLEQINNFNKKYKNEKYADITDPNIYLKMPNVNVKFDKVNNLDNVVYFSRIPVHSQWQQKDHYGDLMPKNYDEVIDSYCHFLPMSDIKNNQFLQFIWRVNEEKNMINLINKKRKEKGLNPLEINNDLNAISKWAAKRCYLGYTYSGYAQIDDFTGKEFTDKHNNINKTADWYCTWKRWIVGKIPFQYKSDKKIYENPWTDEEYEAFTNAKRQNLEESAKELFNYDKNIRVFNQDSIWLSSSKDFINYWEDKKSIDNVNIQNIIYDPKAKSIGVAYLYQAPKYNGDLNGLSGVYLIVSE